MSFVELTIALAPERADAFSDALLDAGALSVSVEEGSGAPFAEQIVSGESGAALALWRNCVVKALFHAYADVATAVGAAAAETGILVPADIRERQLENQDWVRLTQAQFPPTQVSRRLWVVPSWHLPPDPHAINLSIDPGQAFGTGTHPTTTLCLQWLDENLRAQESVLDYGCGSGILSIAAAKLGARRVLALDIDPLALQVARDNAERNRTHIDFVSAHASLAEQFDVTVANILANPLRVLAPLLAHLTRADGTVVLAGILSRQAAEVCASFAPFFAIAEFRELSGWVCLTGRRKR